ncbi:hypothetical protein ACER0C_027611 [Sarotherodon galilaeus]
MQEETRRCFSVPERCRLTCRAAVSYLVCPPFTAVRVRRGVSTAGCGVSPRIMNRSVKLGVNMPRHPPLPTAQPSLLGSALEMVPSRVAAHLAQKELPNLEETLVYFFLCGASVLKR